MALVNLVKSIYTGSDVTSLGEIASGDTVAIPSGSTITTSTSIGAKEKQVAIAASDIDLALGNYFSKTITTTTTFTVSNTATSGTVNSFILDLTNGGSQTINWWANLKWPSGSAPALTTSGRDALGFFTYDGGTTWTGLVLGKDIK